MISPNNSIVPDPIYVSTHDKDKLVLLYNKISDFLGELYDDNIEYDIIPLIINDIKSEFRIIQIVTTDFHPFSDLNMDLINTEQNLTTIQKSIATFDFNIIKNDYFIPNKESNEGLLVLKRMRELINIIELLYNNYQKFK